MVYNDYNRVFAIRSYELAKGQTPEDNDPYGPVKALLLQDEVLNTSFNKVTFSLADIPATLMPEKLFDAASAEHYVDPLIPPSADTVVHYDVLNSRDAVNLYRLPASINKLTSKIFAQKTIYHLYTPLIENFGRLSAKREGIGVYVNIRFRTMQVLVFKQKDLLFCNHFDFTSGKDFIYYLLLVFDQLKIKPTEVPVFLAGKITRESEIYHYIYRYIQKSEFVTYPDFLQFDILDKQDSEYHYFDLYSLALCE